MLVKEFSELEINQVYTIKDTQFGKEFDVRCLGNYLNIGDKVYFTKIGRGEETVESLHDKFQNNRLPNVFVCWDFMVNSTYIIKKKVA